MSVMISFATGACAAGARHTVCASMVNMKLHPQDLQKIAHLTLEHYNQHAKEFWEGTRDHNVSQNIEALLLHIEGKPPFTILDFGCGPGRDLKVFAEKGHIAAPSSPSMAAVWGCSIFRARTSAHGLSPSRKWCGLLKVWGDVE